MHCHMKVKFLKAFHVLAMNHALTYSVSEFLHSGCYL
jgi:hypothetical protein